MFRKLLSQHLQENYSQIIEESQGTDVIKKYEKDDPQYAGIVWGTMPVEYFLKFTEVSKTANAVKKKIIEQIKEMNLSLNAIRTTGTNTEIKKVSCESNLVSTNGKTLPIQYTAQVTEDKKILVTVFGL
jgi:hypothetical protein